MSIEGNDEVLVTSKYLRGTRADQNDADYGQFGGDISHLYFNKESETYLVYHALFGNARIIDKDTYTFLLNALQGVNKKEAVAKTSTDFVNSLINHCFLVKRGYDERSKVTDLLEEREDRLESGELITSLQLILTNGCNFKCEYCFAYNFEVGVNERGRAGEILKNGRPTDIKEDHSTGNEPQWNHHVDQGGRNPKMHMTKEIAEQAIDRAISKKVRHGGGTLSISLFGGEPTLNKPLIIHLLNKYKNGQGTGIAIDWEITTNGSNLPEDLLKCLAKYNLKVAVSVDYINQERKSFRGSGQQKETWDLISNNIMRMIDNGLIPTITSVLSKETWNDWNYELINWVASVGLKEINVIVSFHADFFKEYDPKVVANKLLDAFFYAKSKGVLLSGYWYQTYLLLVDSKKYALQADYKTCPAIGRMLSIEPNGSVFSCKATNKQLGHINAWDELFLSDSYKEYAMRAYSNSKECLGCELEGTCSGGSAGQLEEANHDISKLNHGYCKYIRTVIDGLLNEDLLRFHPAKQLVVE